MIALFPAAAEVQAFCRRADWRFCFIGGLALQRWGEPRYTQDVDLTLLTGFGNEADYVDALLGTFSARLSDAREHALRHRVLLLTAGDGVPVDIALGALPYEEQMIGRSSDWNVAPGLSLRTCSAEDLIVLKAFAGRPQDWVDIERVAVRQAGKLDEALIFEELSPLLELKDDPASAARLRAILAAAAS